MSIPRTTWFATLITIGRSRAWLWGWGLLLLAAPAGCGGVHVGGFGVGIKGSGVLKTEERTVAGFSEIDVSGVAKLAWEAQEEPSLEVTVEDNLLPLLVTEVTGDTLKIFFKGNVSPTKDVVVKVASPSLNALRGSGATQSTLSGVKSDNFKLGLSGSGQCTISGLAKALSVECSGASNLKADELVAGSTSVRMSGSSSAKVQAKELRSVHTEGASNVKVREVNTNDLAIEASGSSECTVSGQVVKLTVHASGAATVHAAGLNAEQVQVEISGSSSLEVDAVKALAGTASGASNVRYPGSPASQTVRTSGSASVGKK